MATISIQSNDFDSYISLTDADVYMLGRIGSSDWATASQLVRQQALVSATRWVQRVLGALVEAADIPDPADDPAPLQLQHATVEAANALVVDSTLQDKSAATSSNIKAVQAGSARVEKFRPESGTALPTIAQALLNSWVSANGGGLLTVGASYGTGESSAFCDIDAHGVELGWA